MEVVACAGKAPEPQTLEAVMRLQVGKTRLDPLPLIARSEERLCLLDRLRNFSHLPKSVWSLGYCRLAFLTLSSSHFDLKRNSEVTYDEFVGIGDVDFVVGFSQIETCWRLSLVKGSRVHPPHRSRSCSPAS